MKILEKHLQSKQSAVPDAGGEDRIVITDHIVAVIDGATAKTNNVYRWQGQDLTPGLMAGVILEDAISKLDPLLDGQDACRFLDQHIYKAYQELGILKDVEDNPQERFTASLALYNNRKRYVILAGDCHAVIGATHYQYDMKIDEIHSAIRSDEIKRAIATGEITLEKLLSLPPDACPGRKLILDPPSGVSYPGLRKQSIYQNKPDPAYGFFAMDGFANFNVRGFAQIHVPSHVDTIIMASDGYTVIEGHDSVEVLSHLHTAEDELHRVLTEDPYCFQLYKSTKGRGSNHSFDDRSYIKISI